MALSLFDTFSRDPFFADWPAMSDRTVGTTPAARALTSLGATDIVETDKAHILHIDVPGVSDENLNVEVQGSNLVISGERKNEYEKDQANFHTVERSYGKFNRSFRLPNDVDATKIAADHRAGTLTVTLPKTGEPKQQKAKIPIRRS